MKVIKEPEKKWSLKFTCEGCSAELEAEDTDIKVTHYDGDFREASYTSFSVNCPCCQQQKVIKQDSLPKLVVISAKQRSKIRE